LSGLIVCSLNPVTTDAPRGRIWVLLRSRLGFGPVPANRIGNAVYSPAELKTMQEVITLIVFAAFTAVYFKEPLSFVQGAGFALIGLGAILVFRGQA
jgi:Putative member of DMT superfamily (DUF486)